MTLPPVPVPLVPAPPVPPPPVPELALEVTVVAAPVVDVALVVSVPEQAAASTTEVALTNFKKDF
jgi:hypothetical protein